MEESLFGLKNKAAEFELKPASEFKPLKRWPKAVTLLLILALTSALTSYGYQYYTAKQRLNQAAKISQQAYLYFNEGYFEDAILALEKANALNSSIPKNYFLMGKAYAFLGQLDKAQDSLIKAIELKNDNPEYHYQLALIFLEKKALTQAQEELNKVLDLNPNFYVARLLLANLLAEQGYLEAALKHFQILATKPLRPKDQAEVHLALARLFMKQETRIQAQHLLQKALKLNPYSEEAQQLNQQIKIVSHSQKYLAGSAKRTDAIDTKIIYPKPNTIIRKRKLAVLVQAQSWKPTIAEVQVSTDDGHSWSAGSIKDPSRNIWQVKITLPKVNQATINLKSRAVTTKGVVEKTTEAVKIEISNAGPPVFYYLDPPNPTASDNWYVFPPKIYLSTSEANASIFYRFNNSPYKVYDEAIKPLPGDNWLYFFSRDRFGVTSPVNKVKVKIKLADVFLNR